MNQTRHSADLAIDRFVERVNRAAPEPLSYDEVPEFLLWDAERARVAHALDAAPGPGGMFAAACLSIVAFASAPGLLQSHGLARRS
jgi:hypothetical protein